MPDEVRGNRARKLFHVSEEEHITRFEPRPADAFAQAVVWGVDEEHLRNYLLPRDCPRVTFYATSASSGDDIRRFLGGDRAVVVIEASWLQRVHECVLYAYHLPSVTFECIDEGAGYHVSTEGVTPFGVSVVRDALGAIRERGAQVRVVDDLWPLHDAVADSTLQYSMIRMRSAQPRRTA